MKPEDPMEKARLLKEKVKSVLEDLEVSVEELSIVVDDEHNDVVRLRIIILPEAVKTPDELEVDSRFSDIIKGLKNEQQILGT